MIRPPDFWHTPGSFLGRVLNPFGMLYGVIGRMRQRLLKPHQKKLPIPVICVGNLVLGGAGKTPTVQAIVHFLQKNGHRPHVILRGYGGRIQSPTPVDPRRHTYRDVGDEALLLSQTAPVWVGSDRFLTAHQAYQDGASCLVFDDGFQNLSVFYDYSFLVIDQDYGLGNGYVFPAGPLRERPQDGFCRASCIILSGVETAQKPLAPLPHSLLMMDYNPLDLEAIRGRDFVAFAGIGRPKKFFNALKAAGVGVLASLSFPDHHPFSPEDFKVLTALAQKHRAPLITTEKDYYRLPPNAPDGIYVLRLIPRLEDLFLNNILREII